jgi:hypothetical protein
MADILPFLEVGVFDPETINAMSSAYDEVCQILKVNGNVREREVVATRIIELARRGERDPAQLRDRVLREAGSENSAP